MQEIIVGKRDFIQRTSKYLSMVEDGYLLTITHHRVPTLQLAQIHKKFVKDLRGTAGKIIMHEDINEPIFPGFDEW